MFPYGKLKLFCGFSLKSITKPMVSYASPLKPIERTKVVDNQHFFFFFFLEKYTRNEMGQINWGGFLLFWGGSQGFFLFIKNSIAPPDVPN